MISPIDSTIAPISRNRAPGMNRGISIREDLLSPEELLQIRFIFAGLVSVLGSPQVREEPELMTKLAQTELGETAIAALKTIAESQRDPSPRRRDGRRPSPFRGTP